MIDYNAPPDQATKDLITSTPEWQKTQNSLAALGKYNPYGTDVSNADTMYRDMGGDINEQAVQTQADMAAQLAQQNTENVSQNFDANAQSRGIAGSALSDYQSAPALQQAVGNEARAKGEAVNAGKKFRMERVDAIKGQLIQQHTQQIDIEHRRRMQDLQNKMSEMQQSTEYNMSNQIQSLQEKQQKEYQQAENELNMSLGLDDATGTSVGTIVGAVGGGIVGALIGGPLGAVTGASLGAGLGGSVGKGIASTGNTRRAGQAQQKFRGR